MRPRLHSHMDPHCLTDPEMLLLCINKRLFGTLHTYTHCGLIGR